MSVLQDLIAILQTENELLQELTELGKTKQARMGDAQEIGELAAAEQGILVRLEALDKERAALFDVVAPGRSLEQWMLELTEAEQKVVAPLIAELVQNLADLRSLNDLNQQLLAESLAYVQFSLNVLLADDGSPTYAPTGPSSPGKTIFDRKV